MASLELIDKISEEISKIRGVDLPLIGIKLMVLSYLMYCANTYDVKYQNEDGQIFRLNSGCILLCQKGTGKSRTLRALKQIFNCIESERERRHTGAREKLIGKLETSMIPLEESEKRTIQEELNALGENFISVFDDPITSKGLCETYAQIKKYHVNNLLFTIDEAGDRLFKDALGRDPSISAREFWNSINQLFDGYCGMGKSKTAKMEGIESQRDVGANFIFVSTAEFLKDYHVQQRYESSFEGGIARRLLYINCPPIDKKNTCRKRFNPKFDDFTKVAEEIFDKTRNPVLSKCIPVSEELWKILEQPGAGSGITIDDEFLLLFFCTVLAVWTKDFQIMPKHWNYMVDTWYEMKNIEIDVVQGDTTNYDKICNFVREYLEKNTDKKKVPIVLVKDYCARNRMCFDSHFKKFFNELLNDFKDANSSKYLLDRNAKSVWINKNYAYTEQ